MNSINRKRIKSSENKQQPGASRSGLLSVERLVFCFILISCFLHIQAWRLICPFTGTSIRGSWARAPARSEPLYPRCPSTAPCWPSWPFPARGTWPSVIPSTPTPWPASKEPARSSSSSFLSVLLRPVLLLSWQNLIIKGQNNKWQISSK